MAGLGQMVLTASVFPIVGTPPETVTTSSVFALPEPFSSYTYVTVGATWLEGACWGSLFLSYSILRAKKCHAPLSEHDYMDLKDLQDGVVSCPSFNL